MLKYLHYPYCRTPLFQNYDSRKKCGFLRQLCVCWEICEGKYRCKNVITVKLTAYCSALVMQLIITNVANSVNISDLNIPAWFELLRECIYCFAKYSWSSKIFLEWELAETSLFHKMVVAGGRSHMHHCAVSCIILECSSSGATICLLTI